MKLLQNIVLVCLFSTAHAQMQQVNFLEPLHDNDGALQDITRACSQISSSYTLLLPASQGEPYQVLGLIDDMGTLSWITTVTDASQLNLLYTATSADIPLTLVLRDSTGSFAATNITLTGNLTLATLTGVLVAQDGLVSATIGIDGTRLASFPLTDVPAVNFFQPVEPSRESYFFDDFIAFNASAGGVFYGDTPWVISNNSYPSRVTSLKNTSSSVGVTRLSTGNMQDSLNYLIKQINADGTSNGVGFGLGPCLNEWRVSIPGSTLSLANSFTVCCGMGDNLGTAPYVPQNGIYFSYTNTGSGAVWQINTAFGGTITQNTSPAVTPLAGVFQRLAYVVDASSSQVDFFIDDLYVGTLYNIPSGNDCSAFASIRTGGSSGSIDLDYWYYHYTFNLRR